MTVDYICDDEYFPDGYYWHNELTVGIGPFETEELCRADYARVRRGENYDSTKINFACGVNE